MAWKGNGRKIIRPIVNVCVKLGIHPNYITLIGFLITIFAGFLYAGGYFRLAALLLLIAGVLDAVDGDVARLTGKKSSFGALLDSALDRLSEAAIFGGVLYFYRNSIWALILIFISFTLSFMVSYLRARGEGLGVSIRVGPMDRTGRYIYLFLISLLGPAFFLKLLVLYALLVFITVVSRWVGLYNSLAKQE
ncbi:MAG: CDP-alcohol phosphatidyltransferase family protein [Candidatus Hydrothermota bacterium]|nr:MAG: CDP-alcohol phosphatidyltransferase family protein [Candidatus Hydrothermae bacterium]